MVQTDSSCLLVRFSFRAKKKSKPLNLKIHSGVGSCENIPAQQRSPLLSERSLRSFFVGHAPFLPSTPPVHTEANFSASKSPLAPRLPWLGPPDHHCAAGHLPCLVHAFCALHPGSESHGSGRVHHLTPPSHMYSSRVLRWFEGSVIGTRR